MFTHRLNHLLPPQYLIRVPHSETDLRMLLKLRSRDVCARTCTSCTSKIDFTERRDIRTVYMPYSLEICK